MKRSDIDSSVHTAGASGSALIFPSWISLALGINGAAGRLQVVLQRLPKDYSEWSVTEAKCEIIGYRSDERVFRQVFVVLSYDGFCFFQRSKPPLDLKIFVSSDTFYNSALFHEQFEFTRLFTAFGILMLRRKINASGREPTPLYDALVW